MDWAVWTIHLLMQHAILIFWTFNATQNKWSLFIFWAQTVCDSMWQWGATSFHVYFWITQLCVINKHVHKDSTFCSFYDLIFPLFKYCLSLHSWYRLCYFHEGLFCLFHGPFHLAQVRETLWPLIMMIRRKKQILNFLQCRISTKITDMRYYTENNILNKTE